MGSFYIVSRKNWQNFALNPIQIYNKAPSNTKSSTLEKSNTTKAEHVNSVFNL